MLPAPGRDLVKWAATDWISQAAHTCCHPVKAPQRVAPSPAQVGAHTHTHAWHRHLGKHQVMSVLWTKRRLPAPPNACAHIWLQGRRGKCLLHGDHRGLNAWLQQTSWASAALPAAE